MKHSPYIIGIDMASEDFTSTAITQPDEIILVNDKVPNCLEGFNYFVDQLSLKGIDQNNCIIVVESTGVYGEKLCYFLNEKNYKVAVEPPNKVKKAFHFKQKNDRVDSKQIAEYGYRFFDKLHFWHPREEILEQVRVLLSTREQLSKQMTSNNNALKALLRKPIQTPLANQLYEENIKRLKEQITQIDKEIEKIVTQNPSIHQTVTNIDKIPTVGLLLAVNVMVITEGFTQNVNAKSIAAYLGKCPYEHTSGKSIYKKPTSEGFGFGRMRKLLYLASMSGATHVPSFRKYYLRKIAEGKPKKLVFNNIANKLLKIICAIINSGEDYNPNYLSINPMMYK
jgi:transposase